MRTAKALKARTRKSSSRPSRGRPRKSSSARAAPLSVRDRILRAAELLFAEHGMVGVGMRALAAAAKCNVASIAYHFGSKVGLVETLFALCAAPIAKARMELLDRAEAEAGGAPTLERIIDAFVRPALTLGSQASAGGETFSRLHARLLTETEKIVRKILSKSFDQSTHRFIDAIDKALPNTPRADVEWRFHFLLGVMFYTMSDSGRIQALTGGRCDPGNANLAIQHMVPYLAAGFRSMPVSGIGRGRAARYSHV